MMLVQLLSRRSLSFREANLPLGRHSEHNSACDVFFAMVSIAHCYHDVLFYIVKPINSASFLTLFASVLFYFLVRSGENKIRGVDYSKDGGFGKFRLKNN